MARRWYEDEGLWEAVEPFLFACHRPPEVTVNEVEQFLRLLAPSPGASVLDLCCGQGRHALEMARRGFRVTGVDRTARYLEAARARAAALGLRVEFVLEDMRRFMRPAAFDLALNLFTSFGYFEDSEEDLQVLRNLRACLKPGGLLLMEMLGKELFRRDFRPREQHRLPDGSATLLEERTVCAGGSWVENRWTLTRGGRSTVYTFGLRLYSGAELRAALRAAGFVRVTLYGSLDGAPYDRLARRLVAVAAA